MATYFLQQSVDSRLLAGRESLLVLLLLASLSANILTEPAEPPSFGIKLFHVLAGKGKAIDLAAIGKENSIGGVDILHLSRSASVASLDVRVPLSAEAAVCRSNLFQTRLLVES